MNQSDSQHWRVSDEDIQTDKVKRKRKSRTCSKNHISDEIN